MKNKSRFGIRPKIMTGYVIMIVCLVIAFIILNRQFLSLEDERNNIMNHEIQIHDLANRLEKYVINMETGQRGFLITGKDSYLETYTEGTENWEDVLNELSRLIGHDDPAQQDRLEEIRKTINHWIETTGDSSIAMQQNGDQKAVEQVLKDDPGKTDMDKRRRLFDTFRKNEQQYTKDNMTELDRKNGVLTIELFGILIAIAVIGIAIAAMTSRLIVNTIRNVTGAIRAITNSKNHTNQRIQVNTKDEIRELGDATNALLDVMDHREWIQNHMADILKATQGIASIDQLATEFLNKISTSVHAELGAFYVRKESESGVYFMKKAAYADTQETAGRKGFKLGEGLIGQCAEVQRMAIIDDIPEDYRPIVSGLGEVAPKSILIVPFVYNNSAIAIMELASLNKFTEQHVHLIRELIDTFGLMVHSVLSRMEVVRLLKESQSMTEELQAQHEELQTQSEELRMQSEELQTTNEQLEERTKDAEAKTEEIHRAKQELEQKNKELELSSNYKSEFLANMSHELRTPLNSILILSEMLSENSAPESEEAEYARIIQSSGKDLLELINDILDLSKVEAGKLEVIIDEMNLSDFAEQTMRRFTHLASQKGLEFKVIEEDIPSLFYTDANRLHQIVKNLISNAIKFTNTGSVTLKLELLEEDQFTETMKEISNDWLALTVTDTGIGIPEDKHNLIFEAFQQADGATSRKYGGTGLGLSICSEFAKLLGGTIFLDSKEGEGSRFTVLLPSLPAGIQENTQFALHNAYNEVAASLGKGENSDAETETKPISAIQHADIFQDKCVLIVDDDQRNIFSLSKVLEKEGMRIIEAHDGIECLEILDSRDDVDLVLMDIMMPQMDGYEATRKIREDLSLQELPIIALTAKAMKQDREKCLEAGASDYISKPVDMEQLLSVMRVWLAPKVRV